MLTVKGDCVVDIETGEIMTITVKQYKVIEMIESNLGIDFRGSTMQEARQFISDNMEKSKQAYHKKSCEAATKRFRTIERSCNISNAYVLSSLNAYFDSYFDSVASKHCDMFSDEDVDDIMPYIDDGDYNPFI